MRTLLLFVSLVALPTFAQKPVAEQKPARVEGRAIHSLTSEPLRKVNVTLTPTGRGGGVARQLSTDVEGRFTFDGIAPGSYQISAERTGFLPQRYAPPGRSQSGPSSTITLASGQALTGIDVKLMPQGAVAGKVLDMDGDPMQRVQVSVMKVTALAGRRRATMQGGGTTNDLGEFRVFNLPPGRYFVMASTSGRGGGGPGGGFRGPQRGQVEKLSNEDYVPTFYPGAIDASGASLIQLEAGREVTGLTFQLGRSANYRIRGSVTGVDVSAPVKKEKQAMRVTLLPADRNAVVMNDGSGISAAVRSDGSFEFSNVQPASYQAIVMRMDRSQAILGKGLVTVSSGNIDGLTLIAADPVTVTGTLKVDGSKKVDLSRAWVTIRPLGTLSMGDVEGRVDTNGAFKLESASRDNFMVTLTGVSDAFIKSIRLDAQDVTQTGIDLSGASSGSKIEITLGTNPGLASGTVKDGEVAAPGLPVTILPDPAQPMQPYLIKTATTDADGKFQVSGLAPGNYKAYAWSAITSELYKDPEFMRRFENDGAKIVVKEGSTERVELKVTKVEP